MPRTWPCTRSSIIPAATTRGLPIGSNARDMFTCDAGENIAYGQTSVAGGDDDLDGKPPHRENILADFTEMGAARVEDDEGDPYWCVDFGTPMPKLKPDEAAAAVVKKLNRDRAAEEKPKLRVEARLGRAAMAVCAAMAEKDSLDVEKDAFKLIDKQGIGGRELRLQLSGNVPTPDEAAKSLLGDDPEDSRPVPRDRRRLRRRQERHALLVRHLRQANRVRAATHAQKGPARHRGEAVTGRHVDRAERGGFEPPKPVSQFNGLANRRYRPLSHLSRTEGRRLGRFPHHQRQSELTRPPAPSSMRLHGSRAALTRIHGAPSPSSEARHRLNMWIARPSTASAASRVASESVGWAWQVRAMSSALPANSMTITASAIMSEARGPRMCTPRTRSVAASARILTSPSVSSIALARPFARNGNLPTL